MAVTPAGIYGVTFEGKKFLAKVIPIDYNKTGRTIKRYARFEIYSFSYRWLGSCSDSSTRP